MNEIATISQWTRALILGLLALCPHFARAEPCELLGGCAGHVWYVHIPESQFRKQTIFGERGLPLVNSVLTTTKAVVLLDTNTFSKAPYPQELARELGQLRKTEQILKDWGNSLRSGSRVRVLSYHTFPQLDSAADELFVMLLVLSE